MDLEVWKDKVMENCKLRSVWVGGRSDIQSEMKSYLQNFFSFDDIEFDYDLNMITLKYQYNHDPVIRMDVIKDFCMDFIITTNSEKDLGQGVWIEVYPFGLPEADIDVGEE